MPAIPANSKVLVTGASGFIAAHICKQLLEKGYNVVGTVRSDEKGQYLKNLFHEERFTYVIVPDNEAPSAFDEAVKGGFAAIAHTSSPFHFNATDPEELIGPALKGTLSVLEAATKYAPTVKRIVVTSSVAAIISPREPGSTFTEVDWNDFSVNEVEREGRKASGTEMYLASKTLAERAAWKYWEDQKKQGTSGWDLVTICPPTVFGPVIQPVKDISALNTSVARFYNAVTNPTFYNDADKTAEQRMNFVDVRDVATAHILALEKEEAAGERFITSKQPYTYQDLLDALNTAGVEGVPKGRPDGPKLVRTYFSGAKVTAVLGLEYRPSIETFTDMLQSLRDRFPEAMKGGSA